MREQVADVIDILLTSDCLLFLCPCRDLSWVKIFNVNQRFEANCIYGHLMAKLVYYLLNIHTLPRSIYLCRVRRWRVGCVFILIGGCSLQGPILRAVLCQQLDPQLCFATHKQLALGSIWGSDRDIKVHVALCSVASVCYVCSDHVCVELDNNEQKH